MTVPITNSKMGRRVNCREKVSSNEAMLCAPNIVVYSLRCILNALSMELIHIFSRLSLTDIRPGGNDTVFTSNFRILCDFLSKSVSEWRK